MKQLEILNKNIDFSKDGVIERDDAIKAMNEYAEHYHKQQVKSLNIGSVSNCTDTKVFEAARAVVDCEGSYYSRCKEAIHYLDELVRIMSEIEDANDAV